MNKKDLPTNLSDERLINGLTTELNKDINIPFFGEKWEYNRLRPVVAWVNTQLEKRLPEHIVDAMLSASLDGLEKNDPQAFRIIIVDELADEIDFLPKKIARRVIAVIVDLLFWALRKGVSLLDFLK